MCNNLDGDVTKSYKMNTQFAMQIKPIFNFKHISYI